MTQAEIVASLKAAVRACAYPCGPRPGAGAGYPLLKDGLGLDSLDCVELTLGMEEEFGLVFDDVRRTGCITSPVSIRCPNSCCYQRRVSMHQRHVRSDERRVVVTGLGVVSPYGRGCRGLLAGLSARAVHARSP